MVLGNGAGYSQSASLLAHNLIAASQLDGQLSELHRILPRRMQVQSELANWFGDYYKNLNVLFTSNLSTNAAVMVNQGLAFSLVIEGAIPFWGSSKIVYRPLYPELWTKSVLAWKQGQPFSLATTKLIEFSKCFLGMSQV